MSPPLTSCVSSVKANPEPGIIQVLAALGAGFDCASGGELGLVLALGVPPCAIIYAHRCKLPQVLAMAREVGPQCCQATVSPTEWLHHHQ